MLEVVMVWSGPHVESTASGTFMGTFYPWGSFVYKAVEVVRQDRRYELFGVVLVRERGHETCPGAPGLLRKVFWITFFEAIVSVSGFDYYYISLPEVL